MQSGGALNFGSWRENPQYFLHLKKSVRFLFLEKKNLICSALSAWYFTKTHRQQKANHMRLQVFLSLPRFLSHCQVSTYLSAENPSGCMRFQPKTCYTFHPTGHRSILLLFSLFPWKLLNPSRTIFDLPAFSTDPLIIIPTTYRPGIKGSFTLIASGNFSQRICVLNSFSGPSSLANEDVVFKKLKMKKEKYFHASVRITFSFNFSSVSAPY